MKSEKRILYKNIYIVSPEVEFLVLVLAIQNSMKILKIIMNIRKVKNILKILKKFQISIEIINLMWINY